MDCIPSTEIPPDRTGFLAVRIAFSLACAVILWGGLLLYSL